jgi:hypothetical protein
MNTLKNKNFLVVLLLAIGSCTGMQRSCAACNAERFGADWVIVQYRNDGKPLGCWKLRDTSVTNEDHSDGIYWKDGAGHLVHISGWYNRVQVTGGDYAGAAASIGVAEAECKNGIYSGQSWFNQLNQTGDPPQQFNRVGHAPATP